MKAVSKSKFYGAAYKDLPRKRGKLLDPSTAKRVKRESGKNSANFWRTPGTVTLI